MTGDKLPEDVRDLLIEVSRRAGRDGKILLLQVDSAKVVSCSPTWIHVAVPNSVPGVTWSDGVIPMSLNPSVFDDLGEPTGMIYIWVENGRLSALEQPWFTDEPPMTWPSVERLVWDLG